MVGAFRHPSYGPDADRLDGLTAAGAGMETAVLQQAVPKLANILRTKQELGVGRLDPRRLGPVLEVAKLRMLVPPGSQRAALVAELHREATSTPLGEHVLSALSLGLSILSFVPGLGLGAKLLAEATSLALELHAQVHEYKDWRTAGGMNNTALDMARSVSQQAPELRPLLLRLAVAGASAASLLQLGRLAVQLGRAHQLGDAEQIGEAILQLDRLGDGVGVRRLGEQLEAIGGVRGPAVYPKKVFLKDGAERLSRLNPEKVQGAVKRVAARAHAHRARFEAAVADATAEAASGTLHLPPQLSAAAVEVRVELRFQGELTPSAAHGAAAGPARYKITQTSEARWRADVEIDQHLDPRDLDHVLGHELDEIAELVRRHPQGPPATGFEREMSAGVMREGAITSHSTAHDVASAREVVGIHRELEKLPAPSANALHREQTLERAISAAGLGEPAQIDAKVRLLREAGAPESLLDRVRRVESQRVLKEHGASRVNLKHHITEDVVDHILWAKERSPADFVSKGMNGGHHTERLLALGRPHGNYVFVEVAARPAAGSIARRFDQYRWVGKGEMPSQGSGRFPTDAVFDPTGWAKSKMPKTTFDDPRALMREAEEAFQKWLDVGGSKSSSDARTFLARTDNGVDIGGFFEETSDGLAPTTVFVEASWF